MDLTKILLLAGFAAVLLFLMTRKKRENTDQGGGPKPSPDTPKQPEQPPPPRDMTRGPLTDSLRDVIHPVVRPPPLILKRETEEWDPKPLPSDAAEERRWHQGFPYSLPRTAPTGRRPVVGRYVFVERRGPGGDNLINVHQIRVFRRGVPLVPRNAMCTNADGQFINGDPPDDCDNVADQLGINLAHAVPIVNHPDRMQRLGIDLGRDQEIDYLMFRIRGMHSMERTLGCVFVVRNEAGSIVYEYTPQTITYAYFIPLN